MAKKLPTLNEVFISSGGRPINVGSAYSLKREGGFPNKQNLGPRQYGSNIGKGKMSEAMKPELDKIVQQYAQEIVSKRGVGLDEVEDILRKFSHDMEKAEGEDPAELDAGGPPAGSTGEK
jgi:hypothetical protein